MAEKESRTEVLAGNVTSLHLPVGENHGDVDIITNTASRIAGPSKKIPSEVVSTAPSITISSWYRYSSYTSGSLM